MICAAKQKSNAEHQRKSRQKRKAAGLCNECHRPRVAGRVRCEKCLARRASYNVKCRGGVNVTCERCGERPPLTMGTYCRECCIWLARCEGGSAEPDVSDSLAIDLEPSERATYLRLLAEKSGGQSVLPFVRLVGIPQAEPVEAPEYSVKVFSEAIRWEG